MSPRAPKPPAPPKPWQRAEAGRYRSADERFTLESDGAGRWFVTDAESLDELGLARTTGPFATLDAAKAAADAARSGPAAESPLAARLAAARDRPAAPTSLKRAATTRAEPAPGPRAKADRTAQPAPEAEPEPRTWLDDLADRDPDAAKRARRLVTALERDGIGDADAVVRRDLLGDRPAVATRLLARDVLRAIGGLRDPNPVTIAEAVAGVLAGSSGRAGLPGWDLRERDSPTGRDRPIRLTADDLLAAAKDDPDRA